MVTVSKPAREMKNIVRRIIKVVLSFEYRGLKDWKFRISNANISKAIAPIKKEVADRVMEYKDKHQTIQEK